MATGNTTLLGLALPVEGELDGTWGDVVNDSITSLVDSAVAGTTTLSTNADVTLTTTNLAANQARQAVLLWTASNGATTRNVTAPAQSKPYIVINSGTGSIVLRGAGPTTGITIIAGERCVAAWNGSDFVKVATSTAGDVTLTGTQTLTNKTISADNNTLSGIAASSFVLSNGSGNIDGAAAQKVIPAGVVVGTTDTQTLTNKTLTSPVIGTIVNTGTLTLPTSTDTLVGRATTDTLTNKTVVAPVVLASATTTQDGVIVTGRAGGSTSLRVTIAPTTLTASRAQTLPDAAGTFVLDAATQTLTNKTLTSPVISTIVNTGTLTLPTSTDTLVGRATTDTLTNKTLTAPTITGAILNDGYTEEVFAVTGTTPALSPTNGSIQTWTLTANSTPTAGTWAAGQSITIQIDDGTAYTVTWTSLAVTWKTDGGSAPTLNTTGVTVIALWKVGSIIYGARVGDA